MSQSNTRPLSLEDKIKFALAEAEKNKEKKDNIFSFLPDFLEEAFESYGTAKIIEGEIAKDGRPLKLAGAAVEEGVKDVASLVPRIGKAVLPDAVEKPIGNFIVDFGDYVNNSLDETNAGIKFKRVAGNVDDFFDIDNLEQEEQLAVNLASMAVPMKAASTISSVLLPGKKGFGKRLLDFTVFDYAIKDESNLQNTEIISYLIPQTEPYLKALELDENDSQAEIELKRIIDSAITAGVFEFGLQLVKGGAFITKAVYSKLSKAEKDEVLIKIVDTMKEGAKESVKRTEAIVKNKIDNPVVNSVDSVDPKKIIDGEPIAVASKAEKLDDGAGQYVQKTGVARVLGSINNAVTRAFKTTGQLPQYLVKPYRELQNYRNAAAREIQKEVKLFSDDLDRATKNLNPADKAKLEGDALLAVNGGRDSILRTERQLNSTALDLAQKNANRINNAAKKKKFSNKKEQKDFLDAEDLRAKRETQQLLDDTQLALQGNVPAYLRLPTKLQKLVNESQSVVGLGDDAFLRLPEYLQETIVKLKRVLNKQDAAVRSIYGLKSTDDYAITLGLGNQTYLTQTYELFTNPKWAKALQKGIQYRATVQAGDTPSKKLIKEYKILDKADDNNVSINQIIDDAFNNLKSKNPDVSDDILWTLLDDFATKGTKGEQGLIFEALSQPTFKFGETSVKVLNKRNFELNEPIKKFLGEIKDPVRKVEETLKKQAEAIAMGKWAREIESFILTNEGKQVFLQGLIPGLPRASTTFLKTPSRSEKFKSIKTPVGESLEAAAARLGTDVRKLLPNTFEYQTSKLMADLFNRGTDFMAPNTGIGGTLFQRMINGTQRVATFGQATQTTLDYAQHIRNIYGMIQALATGGYARPKVLFKTFDAARVMFTNAAKQEKKLRAAVSAYNKRTGTKLNDDVIESAVNGNEEALKSLPKDIQKIVKNSKDFREQSKRRSLGLLDDSVVAEPIRKQTIDTWGGAKTAEGFIDKLLQVPKRGYRRAAEVYGFTDDFGKTVAHMIEVDDLRKIYPNKSYDEIFEMAAERVFEKMPSYSHGVPIVRFLGDKPIGQYPLYTAERVRNNFNIIIRAVKDFNEAITTGNKELAMKAAFSVASIGGVYAGKEALQSYQGQEYGWSDNDFRAVRVGMQDWERGAVLIPTSRIYMDKNGHVVTKFVNGSSLDADNYIRSPLARAHAMFFGGEELTETELQQAKKEALLDVVSQYYALKGVYGGVKTAVTGEDEFGRPIRTGDTFIEDVVDTMAALGTPLEPGFISDASRYIKSIQAEEVLGKGQGKTKSGFPFIAEEQKTALMYGVRNFTRDLTVTSGYMIKPYSFERINSARSFNTKIKEIDLKGRTPEEKEKLRQEIKNEYREIQNRNLERNFQYYERQKVMAAGEYFNFENKKVQFDPREAVSVVYGQDKLITKSDFKSGLALIAGVNVPINLTRRDKKRIIDREVLKFDSLPPDIIGDLAKVQSEYRGQITELYKRKILGIED